MAKYVFEVMNAEVLSIAPSHPTAELHRYLNAMGITSVPVIDEAGIPLGMVSLRDLLAHRTAETAAELMSSPAVVVDQNLEIETAASLLSEIGLHRLICVNLEGRIVGVVSAVDLLRGVLGMPARHPAAFPHYDHDTGAIWTDDLPLDLDTVLAEAPEGPGVVVLIQGGRNRPETVVWAEGANDISGRLIDLVSGAQPVAMRRLLDLPDLRFRAARAPDEGTRLALLTNVARRGRAAHQPG